MANLFTFPTAIVPYVCKESMILGRKKYYELVFMFEHLLSCVIPLRVFAFFYIMTARHLVESSFSVFQAKQNH